MKDDSLWNEPIHFTGDPPAEAVVQPAVEYDVPADVEEAEKRRAAVEALIEQTVGALAARGYGLWRVDWPGGVMCIAEDRDIEKVLARHPNVSRDELVVAFSNPTYTFKELKELGKSHSPGLPRYIWEIKRIQPQAEVVDTEVKKRAHK